MKRIVMMKKLKALVIVPVIASVMLMMFASPVSVMAGEINGNEAAILSAVSVPYAMGDGIYQVSPSYVSRVESYLARDNVNLSQAQVNHYLGLFYSNLGTGIAQGYLVQVGTVEPDPGDNGESGDSGNSGGTSSGGVATEPTNQTGTSTGTGGTTSKGSQTTGTTSGTVTPSKWASAAATETVAGDGTEVVSVVPMDSTMYVSGADTLNIRTSASSSSKKLGTLNAGDKVIVTGATTNGWLQISYDGKKAYVSASYLKLREDLENGNEEFNSEIQNVIDTMKEKDGEDLTTEEVNEILESATESDTEAANKKDYSNAAHFTGNVELGIVASVIALAVIFAAVIVVVIHRMRKK